MRILSIETSCDETAISIIEASGDIASPRFRVLADMTLSQVEVHKKWGGVVPNMAKREHAKNLLPILENVLEEAKMLGATNNAQEIDEKTEKLARELLSREGDLSHLLLSFTTRHEAPDIDLIAVTCGPGLEPALWVGINFAKALALLWNKPYIGINHMEGHVLSVMLEKKNEIYETRNITYPALALLISGGHTELVLMKESLSYEILGETRDDAVGEAFDKVARILGLPYPGGPEISKLAEKATHTTPITLPGPMISSPDYDFSFSGLKTSVLYKTKELGVLTNEQKADIAYEFEQAVTGVLITKTKKAIDAHSVQTLIVSGGVSANKTLRNAFQKLIENSYKNITLLLPDKYLATDNAVMIAVAAYIRYKKCGCPEDITLVANGNLAIA